MPCRQPGSPWRGIHEQTEREFAARYGRAHDSLEAAFEHRFGVPLDRTDIELNSAHHLVIVATKLDASTERIINYLNTQADIAINALLERRVLCLVRPGSAVGGRPSARVYRRRRRSVVFTHPGPAVGRRSRVAGFHTVTIRCRPEKEARRDRHLIRHHQVIGDTLFDYYKNGDEMALIDCEECNNQVSDRAVACPRCGAPVSASTPENKTATHDISGVRTIQQTGKIYKIQQLLAVVLVIVSALMMVAAANGGAVGEQGGSVGALLFLLGLVWFIGARFFAWWNHG